MWLVRREGEEGSPDTQAEGIVPWAGPPVDRFPGGAFTLQAFAQAVPFPWILRPSLPFPDLVSCLPAKPPALESFVPWTVPCPCHSLKAP